MLLKVRRALSAVLFHRRSLIIALALIPVAGGLYFNGSAAGNAIMRSALDDPLSIFASRSPGSRGAGALFQTKSRRLGTRHHATVIGGVPPKERVLPRVRSRTPNLPGTQLLTFDTPPSGTDGGGFVPEAFAATPGTAIPFITPAISGGSGSPISGGGGTATQPGAGVTVTPPAGGAAVIPPGAGTDTPPGSVGAVPEPSTWAMMLIGFFWIGLALRSRPERALKTNGNATMRNGGRA